MIISELKIYDFRRFKSADGAPGLHIMLTLHASYTKVLF